MNIILGEKEVPILTAVGHMETGSNGVQRNIIELWTEEPLTAEDIEYIKTHDSFTTDGGGTYNSYKEVVRYSTWLAQVDPNAVIVQQAPLKRRPQSRKKKRQQSRKRLLQTRHHPPRSRAAGRTMCWWNCSTISLNGQRGFMSGDVRKYEDQPKICCQAHDSTDNSIMEPPTMASLWSPYHAKSAEYALPWIAPMGAQDMYKASTWCTRIARYTSACVIQPTHRRLCTGLAGG